MIQFGKEAEMAVWKRSRNGGAFLRHCESSQGTAMNHSVMGRLIISAILVVATLGAAMAAEPSWTGLYVGGDIGSRWLKNDSNITAASVGTPPVDISGGVSGGSSLHANALRAGVFAGWNLQVAKKWVLGIEGDAGWTGNRTSTRIGSPYPSNISFNTASIAVPGGYPFSQDPTSSFSAQATWDSSARLRAGWLATPSLLLYATGGIAWLHLNETSNCSTVPNGAQGNCSPGNYFNGALGPAVISHSGTLTGGTIGAGVETMFGRNWLARAEYRFTDFGTTTVTDVRTCAGCTFPAEANPLSISYAMRVTTQVVTFGLAYKFGN